MNTIIYEKLKWHADNKEVYDIVKQQYKALMNWLKRNDLLSDDGKQTYKAKVGLDSSLTDDMLTEEGKALMDKCFEDWTKNEAFDYPITFGIFERHMQNRRSTQSDQ